MVTPGTSNSYGRPEGSSNNHIDLENEVVQTVFYAMTCTTLPSSKVKTEIPEVCDGGDEGRKW